MKYIRTKDGIFEFEKRFNLEHYINVGYTNEDIVKKFIRNGNKLADTIEELCDEFVVVGYTTKPLKCSLEDRKLFENKSKYLNVELNSYGERYGYDLKTFLKIKTKCSIFGAIWTDKGLIYVAKMNEEGELELL